MPAPPQITVDVALTPEDWRASLAEEARDGLTAEAKTLQPVWFYDERGSELYDQITKLPEYYPFRAERSLLRDHAAEIVDRTGADTLVELGSGTSEKTHLLLSAMRAEGVLARYVPLDVSAEFLTTAATEIAEQYDVVVHGLVADFTKHLDRLPRGGRRLIAFLGSTIGNLEPPARERFLKEVVAQLEPGDHLLLGTDLVKDTGRLLAAYDDAAGVTSAFNRNALSVLNRELDADFDVDAFTHVARWNDAERRIEMRLRSTRDQVVRVERLGLEVSFAAGEELRTEVSSKFTVDAVRGELAAAGLELVATWIDVDEDFLLSLSRLRNPAP